MHVQLKATRVALSWYVDISYKRSWHLFVCFILNSFSTDERTANHWHKLFCVIILNFGVKNRKFKRLQQITGRTLFLCLYPVKSLV